MSGGAITGCSPAASGSLAAVWTRGLAEPRRAGADRRPCSLMSPSAVLVAASTLSVSLPTRGSTSTDRRGHRRTRTESCPRNGRSVLGSAPRPSARLRWVAKPPAHLVGALSRVSLCIHLHVRVIFERDDLAVVDD